MAGQIEIDWSAQALADLDRFAVFLHEHHPELAPIVAREIIERVQLLGDYPEIGRRIGGRPDYREAVLQVLNSAYVPVSP